MVLHVASIAPISSPARAFHLDHSQLQVQYAASEAVRAFLHAAQPFRDEVLPVLLPPMCFNRHVATEGLRAYSQVEGTLRMAKPCSQLHADTILSRRIKTSTSRRE